MTWYELTTVPFFMLSAVLQKTRGTMHYIMLSAIFALCAGLMVWGFARGNSSHAGASGLIFSYMGFFVLAGAMKRDWLSAKYANGMKGPLVSTVKK